MSSGGQWQQQQQQQQHDYLQSMSSSMPFPQQQQERDEKQQPSLQLQPPQHPDYHQQQPNFQPHNYQHHFTAQPFASSSSASSSPISARPAVSIHAHNYPAHLSIYDNVEDATFHPDDTILAGMGIHLGQSAGDVSSSSSAFSAAHLDHAQIYSQERQSALQWPPSDSSQSIPSSIPYDLYGAAGSSSEPDSSSGGFQHSFEQQQQQTIPPGLYHQQDDYSPTRQQTRKSSRMSLQDQQGKLHTSPSWGSASAAGVITPNVSSVFDQDTQQMNLTHSPSWQQSPSQQQQQYHQPRHYTGLPYPYHSQPDSLGLANPLSEHLTTEVNHFAGQPQQFHAGQPFLYDTSAEMTRPISRASQISLASSSSVPYSMNRSNSLNDTVSEGSYFGQASQGSSSNQPWMVPSPSESEVSSQMQQSNRAARMISTPQRLQHIRDATAASTRTGLSSPGGMGHFNLSPATSMGEFDNTDHRLSAALASNARISSSVSDVSSLSRNRRGNTTPTIQEDDQSESNFSKAHQSMMSPSSSQQSHQRNASLGAAFEDTPSDVIIRRRPLLHQPSIFQQYSPHNTTAEPRNDLPDCSTFIDELMGAYLSTPSRLGLGEKSVLIMTSKVAQKSYGQEKRFLCPPPMVILVGSSWWSSQGGNAKDNTPTVLTPPRLTITMSDESNTQDATLEWASVSGRLIDVSNPSSEMAISGRSIGKQLFINDADDKRRHCEALVHISLPGLSATDRRPLGTFASKPIKVISKPSKKRQSNRTSDLSVNHGSTISLFHRLRSQTVSTRYLCVSGAPTWFKGSDGLPFLNTSENTHLPNQGEPASCFVAKMSSWDTFIIYLVDPHIEASTTTSNKASFFPNYPPPPVNVLPRAAGGQGQPICYNQAVVLQCLNTAVVSPVMVIRRVDRQTTVVGGGQYGSLSSPTGRMDPTVETLGDPVSQLHKIAFEILENPKAHVPLAENRDYNTIPGQSGHFLGCLSEDVGLRKPLGPRQWVTPSFSGPSTPTTPVTPLHLSLSASASSKGDGLSDAMDTPPRRLSEAINAANIAAAQTRYSLSQQRIGTTSGNISPSTSMHGPSSSRSQYSSNGHSPAPVTGPHSGLSSGEEEGSQVKRPRRVSSSVVVAAQKDRNSAAAKSRRRGQSLSIVGMQNQYQLQQQPSPVTTSQQHQQQQAAMQLTFPMTALSSTSSNDSKTHLRRNSSFALSISNSDTSLSWGVPAGALWTVEVHDSDIWTIVGTDIAQHTFYIPPKLVKGIKPPLDVADHGIAHLINVPAPATPITPMPVVQHCTGPSGSSSQKTVKSKATLSTAKTTYVTLTGENLTTDYFVYFGDWRCTRVTSENNSTLYCEPPPVYEEFGLPRGRVPLTLVRKDGVIFPTSHNYQC